MTLRAALYLAVTALLSPAVRAQDDFVAVDPAALPTVDGALLMRVAYATIWALFAVYTVSLIARHRAVDRELRRRPQPHPPTGDEPPTS